MKLTCIKPIHSITILGLRTTNTTQFRVDDPQWKGWRFSVKGASVWIESPPGWRPGQPPDGTHRLVAEIPRALCYVEWEAEEGETIGDSKPDSNAQRKEPKP